MANWSVSTYHKKSCEEHEIYTKDNQTIIRKTGYRWANFYVETNDDNPPEFEFDFVPGGDCVRDSVDMYNCIANNIENVELESMNDGCWEDFEFPEDMDDDERERLQELFDEHGVYEVLENMEGWSQNDCEAWVWGPLAIEDENGNQVRIVCAGPDGQAIDYVEE